MTLPSPILYGVYGTRKGKGDRGVVGGGRGGGRALRNTTIESSRCNTIAIAVGFALYNCKWGGGGQKKGKELPKKKAF